MRSTPPIVVRANKRLKQSLQQGTVLAVTTIAHPLARFGHHPRRVALIQLDDGSKVHGPLTELAEIGQRVQSRLRLSHVTEEKLRVYDVAFEPLSQKEAEKQQQFPGYILALTGPSGVGKSTISRLLLHMCSDYVECVPILTTRQEKAGDDGEYHYVSSKKFSDLLEAGKIVSTTHIPSRSEERWYGYRASDIEAIWKRGKLPVVITEMHLLQGLAKHYGRRSILSFGLLPPGRSKRAMLSHLLRRLRQRGRETEEHIADRLKNAEKDLAFFKEHRDLFDHLVVNEDLDEVVNSLQKHISGLAEA